MNLLQRIALSFAGLLFLAAANLKFFELLQLGITTSSWVFAGTIGLIFVELVLATICFTYTPSDGILPVLAIALTFFLFGVYQSALLLEGAKSCGCFGQFDLPPLLVASVDFLTSSTIFATLRPKIEGPESSRVRMLFRIRVVTVSTVFVLMLAGTSLIKSPVPVALAAAELIPEQSIPFLRPVLKFDASVVGSEFQFEKLVKPSSHFKDFRTGNWILMFVRDDCESCQKIKPEIVRVAQSEQFGKLYSGFIFLGIDALSPASTVSRPSKIFHEHANDRYGWVVPTPMFVELRDGIVTRVNSNPFFIVGGIHHD